MPSDNIKNIREDFDKSKINFAASPDNPLDLFDTWLNLALDIDKNTAICFVLSTVSADCIPNSRVVLLRGLDKNGFTFYTNFNSSKAKDIELNNVVSANFFWNKLEKQVRIVGKAIKVADNISDNYFSSRPRSSQLGSWVSKQSSVVDLHEDFSDKKEKVENQFKGKDVERPKNWGGYCIVPDKIEFWQGRPSRLHDRLLYTKVENIWKKERLSP